MAHIEKRTSASGAVTYKAQVALKGHKRQTATFQSLTKARQWAAGIESAIREGRHFKTTESKKVTLNALIEDWKKTATPKILRDRNHCLNFWMSECGHLSLADLTPKVIRDATKKLTITVSARTGKPLSNTNARKHLATLSKILAGAVEDEVIESNPVAKVSKPELDPGRTRFLDDDERKRLLDACANSKGHWLYNMAILALSTGMRLGEIQGLHWKEPDVKPDGAWGLVDLKNQCVILHMTKNGDKRRVPLVGHALHCIQSAHRCGRMLGTDLVFPGHRVKPKHQGDSVIVKPFDPTPHWRKAVKEAELDNFRFHDLRHSCASYLAMNGATLAEIAEALGHKSLAMVKRYSHLSETHNRSVLERMNSKIFG